MALPRQTLRQRHSGRQRLDVCFAPSLQVAAAVHADGLAGDEVGLEQEDDRLHDRLFAAPSSQRRRGGDVLVVPSRMSQAAPGSDLARSR